MKTTIELPDDLMRSVKIQAARENRKLKDFLREIIDRGLAARTGAKRQSPPRPLALPGPPWTIDDIEEAVRAGRD
jgi:plasmid stability protein